MMGSKYPQPSPNVGWPKTPQPKAGDQPKHVSPPPPPKKVVFAFDERSHDKLDELRAKGVEFQELEVQDPDTDEQRTLVIAESDAMTFGKIRYLWQFLQRIAELEAEVARLQSMLSYRRCGSCGHEDYYSTDRLPYCPCTQCDSADTRVIKAASEED